MCIFNTACSLFAALNASLLPHSISCQPHTPAALLRNQVNCLHLVTPLISLSSPASLCQIVSQHLCETLQPLPPDWLPFDLILNKTTCWLRCLLELLVEYSSHILVDMVHSLIKNETWVEFCRLRQENAASSTAILHEFNK